jgi:hypothetical protein
MKKISRTKAKNMLAKTNGEFFSVQFIKKDGSVRDMVCRTGVTKHLKGGELAFDPAEKGLMVVYEMNVDGYRMINLKALKKVTVGGITYKVV